MQRTGRDSHGQYNLTIEGNIIIAKLTGVVGERLGSSFNQALKTLIHSVEGPWGYFANLIDFGAWPKEVEEGLFITHHLCIQGGCTACAFLLDNPVAKHQLQRVRKSLGLGFEHQIFQQPDQAKQYLYDTIA